MIPSLYLVTDIYLCMLGIVWYAMEAQHTFIFDLNAYFIVYLVNVM